AFASQRLEMLFRRVGRAKAQFGGDLRSGGRKSAGGQVTPDQAEDFQLTRGEFTHGTAPDWGSPRMLGRIGNCDFIQYPTGGKYFFEPIFPEHKKLYTKSTKTDISRLYGRWILLELRCRIPLSSGWFRRFIGADSQASISIPSITPACCATSTRDEYGNAVTHPTSRPRPHPHGQVFEDV